MDLRLVIGSDLRPGDPSETTAATAAELAREILELAGRDYVPVLVGSNVGFADRTTPIASPAALALVVQAMRDDVDTPLYVCAGAGLTEIASAWSRDRSGGLDHHFDHHWRLFGVIRRGPCSFRMPPELRRWMRAHRRETCGRRLGGTGAQAHILSRPTVQARGRSGAAPDRFSTPARTAAGCLDVALDTLP